MENIGLIGILIKIILVIGIIFLVVIALTLLERKVSGWIQDRYGPNRVGPRGILQPIADAVKFLVKEDIIPSHVDRFLYILAPALILIPALLTFAVIPFGGTLVFMKEQGHTIINFQIADLNVGILYILAISSLGVYGIVVGGWASNNKYSLLGGLRSSAQMISYEIAMGLSIISVILLSGSLRLNDVVLSQTSLWNVFRQPLAFLIFLVSAFAETNRLPFDLPEAEQELVGGYHTEYSSMKFASFMLSEYINMITASALIVTLFFGGWHVPFLFQVWHPGELVKQLIQILAFALKTGFFLFFFMWVRWTLPRFRYDHLMNLGWKTLLPLALLNIIVTAFVLAL
jgi:NADH-quinone oxidoreductase subunit H